MIEDGSALKVFFRLFLQDRMEPVVPDHVTSGKVQLEVWRSPEKRRAVELGMGHVALVNVWLIGLNVPRVLPAGVEMVKKRWKGQGWTDDAGKGANSHLSGYDAFRTHPVARLAVTRIEDARMLMEALLP